MDNISRRGENSEKEPERNATDQKHCHSYTIIQHSFGSLINGYQRIKNNKRNPNGKEEIKLSQFADDIILYTENPEDRKLLSVLINETVKVAGYTINTQKFLAFLCTNSKSSERETKETIPFIIILKRIINNILNQMDLNNSLSKTREIYIFYKCTSKSLWDRLQV